MNIRKEKKSDIKAIFEITQQAFENHPVSQGSEQFISIGPGINLRL